MSSIFSCGGEDRGFGEVGFFVLFRVRFLGFWICVWSLFGYMSDDFLIREVICFWGIGDESGVKMLCYL